MILYNITINIDKGVEEEWLSWMKQVHIPNVLSTGMFLRHEIYRIMSDEPQGTSYSIQFFSKSMNEISEYQDKHATQLQQESSEKYGKHFVAFRTLLESVN